MTSSDSLFHLSFPALRRNFYKWKLACADPEEEDEKMKGEHSSLMHTEEPFRDILGGKMD